MKETRFIAQNKEKWLESENLLTQERKEPEKLSTLFTQVVDDLSYSRTYYPNRSVKVYLNKIAREYFSIIYSRQRDKKNAFRMFWVDELPQIIIHCRRELIVAFLFFFLALVIGVFSSMKDPQFANSILGDRYIAMTKANIEKGDPMAVYKSMNEIDMFLEITLNNLLVAFRTYVFGVFFSIGSLASLMSHGIMIGCFQYFFIERGLFVQSALAVWLHGTLEISALVLAGGAGLVLGSGLVFPGTYSRLQAFQISAVRSLKLMLGLAPIIVMAAVIESFLTRYTDVPDFVRLLLILASLTFIIGYFIIYPWMKSRSGFESPIKETRLAPSTEEPVDFNAIKNNADIFREAFLFYRYKFAKLFPWILGVSAIITAIRWWELRGTTSLRLIGEWWEILFGELFFGMAVPHVYSICINALGAALILYVAYKAIASDAVKTRLKFDIRGFLSIFLVMILVYGILYALEGWGIFLLMFTYVSFYLAAYASFASQQSFFESIGRSFTLMGSNYSQVFVLHMVLLLISSTFLMAMSAPLLYMYLSVFKWNFATADPWVADVLLYVELLIKVMAFYMTLPVIAACAAYLYYTLAEITDASHLRKSIETFGVSKSKYSRK